MCVCVCVCVCARMSYNEIRLALGLMKPVVIYQHYVRLHPPALFIKLLTHTPQRERDRERKCVWDVVWWVLMVGVWWHFCFLSFFFFWHFFFFFLAFPPLVVCLHRCDVLALTRFLYLSVSSHSITAAYCISNGLSLLLVQVFSLFLLSYLFPLSFLYVFFSALFISF